MIQNNETVKEKKWLVKASGEAEAQDRIETIHKELGIDPIIATLLYNRGYHDPKSASAFLKMEREMLRNPFDMADMTVAVDRLARAIRDGERITVYGDYDVDGVTAVCTLYLFIKSNGGKVDYYIPNRAGEGYGVSCGAIDYIKENGSNLIITVDTGITANEEIAYAASIGVDVIVTDHHECRAELPEACAVVNPHRPDCPYPFKELAGVGVVFKLICAYEERINRLDRYGSTLKVIKEYADLVAIGTIADVMPIKEENRIIVKYGLGMIEDTKRVGLAALIEASSQNSSRSDKGRTEKFPKRKKKTKITSSYIGFTLAPRINAAGRIRTASMAVELFLCDNYAEALAIAEELCVANKERQNEENKIMKEAYEKIEPLDINKNPVIVLNADDWHHGVIGIVSSRITEKYSRPSILISFEGNQPNNASIDDVGKGSGRSIKGLNLVDALCYCSDHLIKFGGHELAAGLSVTRGELPKFVEMINDFARDKLCDEDLVPIIEADCYIDFASIDLSLAEALRSLEPFGVGNPIPTFVMRQVNLVDICGVSDNKHTRMILGDGRSTLSCMYFSNSPSSIGVYVGDKVDILFTIDINEYMDRKSVQLIVKDVKRSNTQLDRDSKDEERFEQIRAGATFTAAEDYYPTRDDFVAVYKLVQASVHAGEEVLSHRDICSRLRSLGCSVNYVKLKFIIMVFREMNIIGIEEESESYRFSIHYTSNKYNLDKSNILRKLRSQMR